jgi:hypothetical protein
MSSPVTADVAAVVFTMERSALSGVTLTPEELALLLAEFGSPSAALTLALFVIVPLVAVTVATSVIVALAPLLIVPRLQLTGLAALHVPCDGVALTKLTPAGSVSLTTTDVAASGPAFDTVIV